MNKREAFVKYAEEHEVMGDWEEKREFGLLGTRAMKEIRKLLQPVEFKAYYNPGGIAVSGDVIAIMMFNDKIGMYIHVDKFNPRSDLTIMIRTVKHMKDWSGGSNNFINVKEFLSDDFWIETKEDYLRRVE